MAGSDSSQGPGWWQASDGKWYPPEQRPGPAPQTSSPPPSSPPSTPASAPPAAPPMGASGPNGGPDDHPTDGSFFSRLFDLSFRRFVTPSIVKVLFILGVVVISLVSLAVLFGGLASFGDGGVVLVLLAPLYWLLGVIYTRVLLEVIMVLFRIEANTRSSR